MVAQGRVPYHEHDDKDVRAALAQALNERKIRMTDRRMLVLYLVNILVLASVFGYLTHQQHRADAQAAAFQRSVVVNCQANQKNTIAFNGFIVRLQQTYASSPILPAQERKDRVAFFEAAKQPVPQCPPAVR